MKRKDLFQKYKQEQGFDISFQFWDIDRKKTRERIQTYIEWLEEQISDPEQKKQEASDRIYRLTHGNFIMRIRHLASVQELDDWDEKYKVFVESIPPDRYGEFLSLFENNGLNHVMQNWL